MNNDPASWPVIGHFIAADTRDKKHRIAVHRRPGGYGTGIEGNLWSCTSEARSYFLDNGMPVEADRENEGVFFSVMSNEVYRKV